MNPRTALRSERGAFDLPSIITGVVVVAILTAGVLAAIFGIIPFAQDNASKQDISAVRTAEAVAKTKDGRFMDTAGLTAAGYLPGNAVTASGPAGGAGSDFARVAETVKLKAAVGVPADARCFLAVAKSGSGTIFYGTDVSAEAKLLNSTDDPGCLTKAELRALIDSIGGFEGGYAPQSPAVTGSVADRTTAVFTWPAVADATGYRVEARINDGDWTLKAENQTDTRSAVSAGEAETVEVRVAARNDSGDSEFATASVKLADPIVANGGFENALASWTTTGTASAAGSARTGAGSVLIGPGTGANTGLVKQTVTIPDNMYSTLTYSYDVDSSGGTTWDSADSFAVRLYNGATVVSTAQSSSAVAGGWVTKTFDVTAQRGKTLDLQFSVYNNGTGYAASVRFDDVAITTSPATPPAAPVVGASASDGTATVTWAVPASPATPITSYSVTPYKDGAAQTPVQITGNPPANRMTFTGLTNGSSYAYTVAATNAAGTSPASATSVTVVPGPVMIVNGGFENGLEGWSVSNGVFVSADANARTGVGSLKVHNTQTVANDMSVTQTVALPADSVSTLKFWYSAEAQSGNGGGSMRVQILNTAGTVIGTPGSALAGNSSWSQQAFDLSQWRGQTVGVRLLVQQSGISPSLTSYFDDVILTSTPAKVTAAPLNVTAAAGDTAAQLKWSVPPSPGSTLSGYTVTPYLDGAAQTSVQVGTTPKTTITGLTNGSSYTFTVRANNTIGTSPESAQTAPVTPTQIPLANGDFEAGVASWTLGGTDAPAASTTHYAGAKSAWVGGSLNSTSNMSQSFTVPVSGTSTLTFWYKGGSQECWDLVSANLTDGLGNNVGTPLNKRICNAEDSTWKQYTADLSAYKGLTLSLKFNVNNDSQWASAAYFDDVTVTTR
jgi:hypothetical protein